MGMDLKVSLSEKAARALRQLAYHQRRRPEAQAEVLLEARLGLRAEDPPAGNPSLRLVSSQDSTREEGRDGS